MISIIMLSFISLFEWLVVCIRKKLIIFVNFFVGQRQERWPNVVQGTFGAR